MTAPSREERERLAKFMDVEAHLASLWSQERDDPAEMRADHANEEADYRAIAALLRAGAPSDTLRLHDELRRMERWTADDHTDYSRGYLAALRYITTGDAGAVPTGPYGLTYSEALRARDVVAEAIETNEKAMRQAQQLVGFYDAYDTEHATEYAALWRRQVEVRRVTVEALRAALQGSSHPSGDTQGP